LPGSNCPSHEGEKEKRGNKEQVVLFPQRHCVSERRRGGEGLGGKQSKRPVVGALIRNLATNCSKKKKKKGKRREEDRYTYKTTAGPLKGRGKKRNVGS